MAINSVQMLASLAKVAVGTRQEQNKHQPNVVTTATATATAAARGDAVEVVPPGRETAQQLILKGMLDSLDGIIQAEGFSPLANIDPVEFSTEKVVERVLAQAESFLSQVENKADFNRILGEVRKGIEQGFKRANIVLGDLGALDNKEVTADIKETRVLIRDGLTRLSDNIISRLLEQSDAKAAANPTDSATNPTNPIADPSASGPKQTPV